MLARHNILIVYINHSCLYPESESHETQDIMDYVLTYMKVWLEMHSQAIPHLGHQTWVFPPTISSQLACFILCTLLRWYVRKSGYYSMWPHQLLSLAFFSFFPKIVWNYSRWIIIKIIALLIYHGQGTCKSAWLKINHRDYLKYRHTSLYSALLYRVSQILWPFFFKNKLKLCSNLAFVRWWLALFSNKVLLFFCFNSCLSIFCFLNHFLIEG